MCIHSTPNYSHQSCCDPAEPHELPGDACSCAGERSQQNSPAAQPPKQTASHLLDGVLGVSWKDQDDFPIPELRHNPLFLPALPQRGGGKKKKTKQNMELAVWGEGK